MGADAAAGPVGSVWWLVPGGAAAGAGPGVAGSLSGLVQIVALGGGGSGPVRASFGLTGLEPFGFAAGVVGCFVWLLMVLHL